jgi:excinuclease Cho
VPRRTGTGAARRGPGLLSRRAVRAALGQCAGLCRNEETAPQHAQRLFEGLQPLRIACWPHDGAIGLVERAAEAVQIHVVRNWSYLGSATTLEEARAMDARGAAFDADSYKILCGPVLAGAGEIVDL